MEAQGLRKKRGLDNVSPHTMRHTFITHLADGGFSATQISAWSGDRIKTLETNYLHTSAPKGAIDDLYSQEEKISPEAALKVIQEQLGKIEPELIGKVESLLKEHPQSFESWEWSNSAPSIHAKMYSVQDTVASRGLFHALLDPGDGFIEDEPMDDVWEEGIYSTERGRLHTLQGRGLIQRVQSEASTPAEKVPSKR